MTDIHAEVTFMVKAGVEDALLAKAKQVDEEVGNIEPDVPETYTMLQALQIVWHNEPEWLHQNILFGWTLDKGTDESGQMRSVWG